MDTERKVKNTEKDARIEMNPKKKILIKYKPDQCIMNYLHCFNFSLSIRHGSVFWRV